MSPKSITVQHSAETVPDLIVYCLLHFDSLLVVEEVETSVSRNKNLSLKNYNRKNFYKDMMRV